MEERTSKTGYKSNHLQAGDVFVPMFGTTSVKEGTFGPMYSIKAKHGGEEKYISITKAQNDALVKLGEAKVFDKTLHCVSYDTANRKGCVGIRQGEPNVNPTE